MKLNLSKNAINLLKFVLMYSGEKELNVEGKEVLSAYKLNYDKDAQRRHFFKKIKDFVDKNDKETNEFVNVAKSEWKSKNEKKDGETEQQYEVRMVNVLNADADIVGKLKEFSEEKFEFELEDKTWNVVKEAFVSYGNIGGFGVGPDQAVLEELDQYFA